jgi:glycosyltransferase involved in cell wall biosynthesis
VLRPLSRFLWRKAASLTVLSRNLQELARQTDPETESVVIGNGVDNDMFPAKPSSSTTEPVRLISVCRMVPRKGLEYLIEAMKELCKDGIELELVGSGQELDRIRRLVHDSGLAGCVKLPGYVPSESLYAHYHRADIFVVPSLSESFGQVLIEAMSCGLPIVASAVGGIPETVRDKRNGLLIPPRDPAAIVAAVRWLAANPRRRARMGRENAELARQSFSWPAIAAQYEGLYYQAVDKADARRQTG